MCKRTVIVSGGMLEEDFVLPILEAEETEFIIGVDKGLAFLYEHKIKPDYIVGDFDSVPEEVIDYYRKEASVPIREFNPVKDASDTEIALRMCLGLRRKEIWILGGTGNRLDHFWANVQCLNIALEAGSQFAEKKLSESIFQYFRCNFRLRISVSAVQNIHCRIICSHQETACV